MRYFTHLLVFAALVLDVWSASAAETEKKPAAALANLPSKPGPHIEKLTALGDNEWLNLGAPAPDAKWGKARGRS